MPGEFSKLLLHTAVALVYAALYSERLELDATAPVPASSSEPQKRKRKPHPKVVSVSVQAPKQSLLVQGVQKPVRRAIGTVQYQEAEEVPAARREDMTSPQASLHERLPLRLVRIKTYSLRTDARSFEVLRVS